MASFVIGLRLTLVAALAACAPAPQLVRDMPRIAADVPSGPGGLVAPVMFRVAYDDIEDIFFRVVDFGELSLDGINGLSAIDPEIAVRRGDNIIELTQNGIVFDGFVPPRADDRRDWASLVHNAIDRARRVSLPLRQADPEAIYEAVFDAMMTNLDPYSRYLSAAQARAERASREGYGGVGLQLDYDEEERAFVEDVFPNSPAERAGVVAGDQIMAVDGVSTAGMPAEDLGDRLRGEVDTVVEVTLRSPSGSDRTIEITRAQVIQNTVRTRFEDNVAIVRITRFNAATTDQLVDALRQVRAARPLGLILDLRGNPGGKLDQSVAVADAFVTDGEIVSTRGRNPDSIQHFYASRDDLVGGMPIVVLMDEHSASGSEVAAAALQDAGRALIVGSTSFGKGSVQNVANMPNDGEMFLTWSRFFAPSGYTVHEQGVVPTICTSNGANTAGAVLAEFRQRGAGLPSNLAAMRHAAAEDPAMLERVRAICPFEEHDDELDVAVAKLLLQDRALFSQALAAAPRSQLAAGQ